LNVTEYTYLLNHPNAINDKQAKSLENVLDNFPYFQSARALHLKGLYNQDSYKYNFALKTTAAHTADRSVLFDFITSDEFTIIEKDIYQKKLTELLNINVNDSEHLTQETIVIEKTVEIKTEIYDNPVIETINEDVEFISESKTKIEEVVNSSYETIDFVPKIEATEIIETTEIESDLETEPVLSVKDSNFEIETPLSDSRDVEENLEIGKPITFVQSEKHSFQEWLQLASFKPIERGIIAEETKKAKTTTEKETSKEEKSDKKTKKIELIDKFIENNPKITPARDLVDTPIKPIEIPDTTHLMTETLARVYLEQKKYQKAIQAYEILILKYPEKSIFFADRIQNIKILQQNNQ